MSRSGYSYDVEQNILNLYRGNVDRAIKGNRGQAFLREMAAALDAMPEKKLISYELVSETGEVCAMGSVIKARGIDARKLDPNKPDDVAKAVGISRCLAAEIAYENDEGNPFAVDTPWQRWKRMRGWITEHLCESPASQSA